MFRVYDNVSIFYRSIVKAVIVSLLWVIVMTGNNISSAESETKVITQIQKLRTDARTALKDGDAISAYNLASRAAKLGSNKLGLLHAVNLETYLLISELAGRLDQPAMSIIYAENAFSSAEKNLNPEDPMMGTVLRTMGEAFSRAGNYESAEELLQAAIAIHEDAPDIYLTGLADDLIALVKLYLRSGNVFALASVPKMLKRAREIREKIDGTSSVSVAEVWLLHGEAIVATFADAAKEGKLTEDKVRDAGELAFKMAEQMLAQHFDPSNPAFIPVYRYRGDLYMKSGQFNKAFDQYGLAVQLGGNTPSARDALRLAVLAAIQSDAELTMSACKAANAISYSEFREFSQWAGIPDELKYRNRSNLTQQLCLSLIYNLDIEDKEKARAMLDIGMRWRAAAVRSESTRYSMLRKTDNTMLLADVSELNKYRRQLAQALTNTVRTSQSNVETISGILDQVRHFEEIIALENFYPPPPLENSVPTTEELASHLLGNSAMLMFSIINDFDLQSHSWSGSGKYVALILQPDGKVILRELGSTDDIESRVLPALQRFRTLSKLDPAPQLEIMSELYDLLWSPFADELEPYSMILTITEGPISLVPLAALRCNNKQFLVETKQIIHIVSPLDIIEDDETEHSPDREMLLVVDPDFGNVNDKLKKGNPFIFQKLKAASAELDVIKSIFESPVEVLSRKKATKNAIRAKSKSRIVHFATHGFFLTDDDIESVYALQQPLINEGHDPIDHEIDLMRSGLAVTGANSGTGADEEDGILTALEIAGMDFSGTQLVTLSACETGLGITQKDEGVFGLRLAFQLAGARNLIMSLWVAHSRELKSEMRLLYQLIDKGYTPSAALQEMQLERIRWFRKYSKNEAPPRVWAAFIAQSHSPLIRIKGSDHLKTDRK